MTDHGRAAGLALATVVDAVDPDGRGWVKVSFFGEGGIESDWIPLASSYAGNGYGSFFLPMTGDLAVVGFISANADQPCVLGFLWNGGIAPPVAKDKQAAVRVIRTRQGKLLRLDDSDSAVVTLSDERGNRVTIDSSKDLVTLESAGDLTIRATGTLTLSGGTVAVKQTAETAKLTLSAEGGTLAGGSSLKLSAAMIDLN
ncbi:hypothetical protein ASE86_11265 [Sphingomonas sp. Leaf33]|uniref:phage baseplate assembly protein V n=1 Tax=Sphingomonas sp. Leaf33 TaxID=1736215 RepID=UPI0006F8CB74|nr:phage baseplate assembly protein V [Sphingomonas sp. Leaf33]KQN26645.1 hypothetical protein ASE86_11265 [Sphingomonas sp. Leaf33]